MLKCFTISQLAELERLERIERDCGMRVSDLYRAFMDNLGSYARLENARYAQRQANNAVNAYKRRIGYLY